MKRIYVMPKQPNQKANKTETKKTKPAPQKLHISKAVVTKTAAFFDVYVKTTLDINASTADIIKSTAALGVAIDAYGLWLLPLMEGRPNATWTTWYEGTKDCPQKGYKHVFDNKDATAEPALKKQWARTHAYIETLRVRHDKSKVKDTVEFRHCLMFIKRHCMYWQGIQQTKPATARADKKGIPALFKKAQAAGFNKPRTGRSGTSTVTPGTHTWKIVDQQIKNAMVSLEIMRTKSLSTDTETSQRNAAHCGNVLFSLEGVKSMRAQFTAK